MIVLIPTDTTHLISFIPRFIPSYDLVVELYNEATQQFQTIDNIYIYDNGLVTITFDLICTESQKFQLKVTEETNVIYRDKIFVTSQDTQALKATKDQYYYE